MYILDDWNRTVRTAKNVKTWKQSKFFNLTLLYKSADSQQIHMYIQNHTC